MECLRIATQYNIFPDLIMWQCNICLQPLNRFKGKFHNLRYQVGSNAYGFHATGVFKAFLRFTFCRSYSIVTSWSRYTLMLSSYFMRSSLLMAAMSTICSSFSKTALRALKGNLCNFSIFFNLNVRLFPIRPYMSYLRMSS